MSLSPTLSFILSVFLYCCLSFFLAVLSLLFLLLLFLLFLFSIFSFSLDSTRFHVSSYSMVRSVPLYIRIAVQYFTPMRNLLSSIETIRGTDVYPLSLWAFAYCNLSYSKLRGGKRKKTHMSNGNLKERKSMWIESRTLLSHQFYVRKVQSYIFLSCIY